MALGCTCDSACHSYTQSSRMLSHGVVALAGPLHINGGLGPCTRLFARHTVAGCEMCHLLKCCWLAGLPCSWSSGVHVPGMAGLPGCMPVIQLLLIRLVCGILPQRLEASVSPSSMVLQTGQLLLCCVSACELLVRLRRGVCC